WAASIPPDADVAERAARRRDCADAGVVVRPALWPAAVGRGPAAAGGPASGARRPAARARPRRRVGAGGGRFAAMAGHAVIHSGPPWSVGARGCGEPCRGAAPAAPGAWDECAGAFGRLRACSGSPSPLAPEYRGEGSLVEPTLKFGPPPP